MRSKFLYFFFICILNFSFFSISFSSEQFNFDITEIQILDNGNIVKGLKQGKASTNDGVEIEAESFFYYKIENELQAEGNVKIKDINNDVIIFTDSIVYKKNDEIILTNGKSKAVYNNNKIITSTNFKFERDKNILNASNNVKIHDKVQDYIIYTEDITYYKNFEKIITKGKTNSIFQSKYEIESEDIIYLIKENKLSSPKKTRIKDSNSNIYSLTKFNYQTNNEILKGEEILIITNYNTPKSDRYFFANGFVDLKNQKFLGKDTDIRIHKSVFDNSDNDPRLKGVSAKTESNITTINKGVFTSCKITGKDKCPPWSITANKIEHNKDKKQLSYENALLKLYDFPVFYFPKFFHPDPTVERQTGFLKPELNNSNTLGSSITLPYFKVISDNKDYTFTPTWTDDGILIAQTEYRQANKNSNFIADIGFVNNYNSPTTKKTKNLSHFFSRYDLDLRLESYNSSNLSLSMEKVSNDTYLKIFNNHITKSDVRPNDPDKLRNNIKLFLDHENYSLETGIETFQTLKSSKSDQYQYILPYYNFNTLISQNYINGELSLYSTGSNDLNNTNKLKTTIINDLTYDSESFISNFGLENNFSINLKNLNSVGKNTNEYKSSPELDLVGLFNANLSLPLIKKGNKYTNILTPKLSFKFNPSDMKDHSSSSNKIDVNNIFATNRLGLSDTFESGKSITLGLDFQKNIVNNLNEINNYFELKLATVIRDEEENFISNKSTINKKNSNLFGLIKANLSENINIGYNFSIDNDYSTFEYNDINTTFSLNNFITTFNFIEENGDIGDTNVFTTSVSYNHDDKNYFTFNTRRNRKINLTEYYDLVYEYKNDCLTAGIKYNKTYYSDGDLKPTENLLFTITLFPLTNYEYKANDLLRN